MLYTIVQKLMYRLIVQKLIYSPETDVSLHVVHNSPETDVQVVQNNPETDVQNSPERNSCRSQLMFFVQ